MMEYIRIFLAFLLFKVEFSKTGLIISGKQKWNYKMVPRKFSLFLVLIVYAISLFFKEMVNSIKYIIVELQKEWGKSINNVETDDIHVTVGEIPKKYDRYKYF